MEKKAWKWTGKRIVLLAAVILLAVFCVWWLRPRSVGRLMDFPDQPLWVEVEQAGTHESATVREAEALHSIRQALLDTQVQFRNIYDGGGVILSDTAQGISGDAFYLLASRQTGPDSLEESERVFLRYDGYVLVGTDMGSIEYQICDPKDTEELLRLARAAVEASQTAA